LQRQFEVKRNGESLQEKIIGLMTGTKPYFLSIFREMADKNPENALVLYDFIVAEQNELNIRESTKLTHVKIVCWFSGFLEYKLFRKITKADVLEYLNSLRKPESEDPSHKWIGTYNTRQMVLNKFFRWVYNREEPDHQKWVTPPCMQGIRRLPRKEKSPYRPSDIWTNEEHSVFLKYCSSKQMKCYHGMASDTSARPHELLGLRIKDVMFKVSSSGVQYAEVQITRSKTRPRTLPLIFSVPYVKDWIDNHPMGHSPEAFLFVALSTVNYGKPLTEEALRKQYSRQYKERYFPKLLEDPAVPDADKAYMKNMLTKPWNPYIQRHSALTAKSQILKESMLRDHAGWTMTSKMPNVYLHYFGNESSKLLLEAFGVEQHTQRQLSALKTKPCPNCSTPNKMESKFCAKCRMVLSYDAYSEAIEEKEEKDEEVNLLKSQVRLILSAFAAADASTKNRIAKQLFQSGIYKLDTNNERLPSTP
jgi:integrase